MSEWIKVRLTGNLCYKLAGAGIMGLSLILGIAVLNTTFSEQLIGFLLAGLFLTFLLGYGIFYWANSRYLLANPKTKEIRFRQALKKDLMYSLNDLTSLTILKYNVHIQLRNIQYSFLYEEENRDFITFLKKNSPLWNIDAEHIRTLETFPEFVTEPESSIPAKYSRLIYTRRLLLLLILLFIFTLFLNLTRHIIVVVLLCSILVSAFLMHLSDWILLLKLYTSVLHHGTVYSGTISRFTSRTGRQSMPYFTFEDEHGLHEVASLVPMNLTRKEELDAIGRQYTIWYAPDESNGVLYGSDEPEPLPARYFSLLLLGQMFVGLVFLMLLFFTSFSNHVAMIP